MITYTTDIIYVIIGFLMVSGSVLAFSMLLSAGLDGPGSISSIDGPDSTSSQFTFLLFGSLGVFFWLVRWISKTAPLEVFLGYREFQTTHHYKERFESALKIGVLLSVLLLGIYASLSLILSEENWSDVTESINSFAVSGQLLPFIWSISLVLCCIGIGLVMIRKMKTDRLSKIGFYFGPGMVVVIFTGFLGVLGVDALIHEMMVDAPLNATETDFYEQMRVIPGGVQQTLIVVGAWVSVGAMKIPFMFALVSRISLSDLGVATAAVCLALVTIFAAFQGRAVSAIVLGGAGVILIWEVGSYSVKIVGDAISPVDDQSSNTNVRFLIVFHLLKIIVLLSLGLVLLVPLWIMGAALNLSPVEAVLVAFVGGLGLVAVLFILSKEFDRLTGEE